MQAAGFDFKFANFVFLNFAAEGGWELAYEADVGGDFVVGDLAFAEVAYLFFSGFDAGTRADPGYDDLAQARVGDAATCTSSTLGWV